MAARWFERARFGRISILVLMAAGVAACGDDGVQASVARPVLVARAAEAAGPARAELSAFAGEVRAREETALAFRVGGKVLRRSVDVGDRVRAGDVVAELDPGDLRLQAESLQAQATAAEAQLARARADHARVSALAEDRLVSRSALDQQTAALRAAEGQARAARAQRDLALNQAAYGQLRAPRDGVIASRQIEAGQVVAAGQPAFTLAADGGREVAFALPESRIREFRIGQPVVIESWSRRGERLPGRIREIAPSADPQARTYAARATLDGEAGRAVDLGQSARVYIPGDAPAGLHLPLSALQRDGKGAAAVWVVDPATRKVRQVAVKTDPYGDDGVDVRSGLKPDDWVVMAGGHLLHEGALVQPVDRSNRPVLNASVQAK